MAGPALRGWSAARPLGYDASHFHGRARGRERPRGEGRSRSQAGAGEAKWRLTYLLSVRPFERVTASPRFLCLRRAPAANGLTPRLLAIRDQDRACVTHASRLDGLEDW